MLRLVAARAAPAATVSALYARALLVQTRTRHAADTRCVEVVLLSLDAAHAAELLVALLLPGGEGMSAAVAGAGVCGRGGYHFAIRLRSP